MAEGVRKLECDEQVLWSELPSLVVENIYSFLDLPYRVDMSLVCPSWSQALCSPALWKTFKFDFRDVKYKEYPWKYIMQRPMEYLKLVERCSRMLKHVQIVYNPRMKEEVLSTWIEDFKIFSHILSNSSQLDSVRFIDDRRSADPNAELQYFLNIPIYEDMCEAIANFLGTQRQLKRLEFKKWPFQYKDAVKFLQRVSENSKESLQILAIPDFIPNPHGERDSACEQLLTTIFGFPNLSFLEIDHWLIVSGKEAILSDVVEKLKNCGKQTILRIQARIEIGVDFKEFKLLKSSDWRYLKQKYPNMEVEIKPGFVKASPPPKFFIVENMPVTRLKHTFFDHLFSNHSYPKEIDALLKYHLDCKINEHLVFFNLRWQKPIPNLASAFIPFLNACKKLKALKVYTEYPPNHLDDLLESLLLNRHETLREFKITFFRARTKNDIKALHTLSSAFQPRFQLVNLKLEINVYDF